MGIWDRARAAKLLAKCLITALLLLVAFRTVDVAAVSKLLSRISGSWAAAAFAFTALIIVADALLLEGVIRAFKRRKPFGTPLLYSLVGWFFSNVAPSTVGGDVFRGIQLSRVGMSAGAATRLIVAIRVLSFSTLILVLSAGFPIALRRLSAPRDVVVLGTILFAGAGAVITLFLLAHLTSRVPKLEGWTFFHRIDAIAGDFRMLITPTPRIGAAWLAALAQHLLRIATMACLGIGLGLGIPFAVLFAFTPAALLMAMLPISLGGWGIRELTFVYFLGAAGIGAEAALSLSIAFGLLRVVVGAIGGAAWVAMNDDHFRVDASA